MTTPQEPNTMRFKVLNGPGKFDLMVALFDSKEVTFSVVGKRKIQLAVTIRAIEKYTCEKDGSIRLWLIKGWCWFPDRLWEYDLFEGFYDSVTRKGHLDIEMPSEVVERLKLGK